MRYALIGMSNIGKSLWSKRLTATHGFTRYDCDSEIERLLGSELTKLGLRGIHDVAAWMGHPYAPSYPQASARYIACEEEVVRQALAAIALAPQEGSVIDTTGSIIYLPQPILDELRAAVTVVYLEASDAHRAQMFKNFIDHPKPVIWGDSYRPKEGESETDALHRCYGDLLRDRDHRYRKLAHVILPFESHRNRSGDILETITAARVAARSA